MIKLKDILLETYAPLVEKKGDNKPLSDKDKKKAKDAGLVHFGSGAWGKKADKGKKNAKATHRNEDGKLVKIKTQTSKQQKQPAKPVDDKPKSKKELDKAQKAADKKEQKELEKIKKTKVVVKTPGKADKEISIEDILPEPFGNAKDDSHPQSDDAKQKVYEMYQERYEKEASKETKKRLENKDKNGDPILSKEEQALYEKEVEAIKKQNEENKNEEWYDEKPIPNKSSFLENKIGKDYEKKSDYFDPDGNEYGNKNNFWAKQEAGEEDDFFGDFGDDDEDWDDDFGEKSVDDYGKKLSKRGDKKQKKALEMKMRIGVGNTTKVSKKSTHIVTDVDGNPTALAVFKDDKTGKYYGIDDEGNIYENDTDDFTKMTEPTDNARGFDGAVTKRGQSKINTREGRPEDDEDDYDKTTFADLLGMLGIETDIDWKDPFGSDSGM